MPSEKPDSFQCGPFEVARNPDVRTFVEKLNRLREAVDSCRLQPGVGYTLTRSPGGTTLSIKAGGGGGTAQEEPYPWKVTMGSDEDGLYYTVEPQSFLFVYGRDNFLEPSNFREKVRIAPRPLDVRYHAVLQVQIDPESGATGAELKAYPVSEYPGLVVPQDSPQTQSNTILATITTAGSVVQAVRGNLQEALVNVGGYPAFIPLTYQSIEG